MSEFKSSFFKALNQIDDCCTSLKNDQNSNMRMMFDTKVECYFNADGKAEFKFLLELEFLNRLKI